MGNPLTEAAKATIKNAIREMSEAEMKAVLKTTVKGLGKENAELLARELGEAEGKALVTGAIEETFEAGVKDTVEAGAKRSVAERARDVVKGAVEKGSRGNSFARGAVRETVGIGKVAAGAGKTAFKSHPILGGVFLWDQFGNEGKWTGGAIELVNKMLPEADVESMAKTEFVKVDDRAVAIITDKTGEVTREDAGSWAEYEEARDEIAARYQPEEAPEKDRGFIAGLLDKVGLGSVADKLDDWGISKYLNGNTGLLLGGLAMVFFGKDIAGMFKGQGATGGLLSGVGSFLLPIAGIAMAYFGGKDLFFGDKGDDSTQERGPTAPERTRTRGIEIDTPERSKKIETEGPATTAPAEEVDLRNLVKGEGVREGMRNVKGGSDTGEVARGDVPDARKPETTKTV